MEELLMVPDGLVQFRRLRRNLFDELTDMKFVALTRLEEHLRLGPRNNAVSPSDQVRELYFRKIFVYKNMKIVSTSSALLRSALISLSLNKQS